MGSSSSKKDVVEDIAVVKGADKDTDYGSINQKPASDQTDGPSEESKPELVTEAAAKTETEDIKAAADPPQETAKSVSKETLVKTKRE